MTNATIRRFSYGERIVHWVVGTSFVALLLTGLAFSYPSLFWITSLVGGGAAARALHPWIGLAFGIGLVAMFAVWVQDMFLDPDDRRWLRAIKHYAVHERDRVPPAGKYNAGQKAFFWLQTAFGVLLVISGLPIWLPDGVLGVGVSGAGLLTTMRLLHYVSALGGGLLLIVHIYLGTVAYPGTARGMITALLRGEGWLVNHKRVERLWRREGLKVPQRQPKRGRLWLADGSCVRRRPTYRHHVWAYDFVAERTHEGRPLKILAVVDEYSRECLALVVARRLRAMDVLETLAQLFVTHGVPAHIRSDNGPEFTADLVRSWLEALDVATLFIEPGSPWENGYVESFNGKLRDELLDREIFYTLTEARIVIERWRREYNTVRPHSALGYRPPAPQAVTLTPISGLIMSPALS